MTDATPLASEQITQEDHIREMAEANVERHAFTTDVDMAAAVELAVTVGLTLSATPAPSAVSEKMMAAAAKAITDRYYAGGKVHQLTAVKPRELANIVLQAAFACEECGGSGYTRWLGRDNSEDVAECSACTPAPSGQGVSGAEEAEHLRRCELEQIADGAYGDGPFTRGAARDQLAAMDAAPAPSCAPGEVDYRLKLAMALFEARYGMRLMAWSDETRDYWLAQADAALSPQGKAERKWPGLSCVTSGEDVTRIADVPDTEIPTPVQAVRWLAKFSNPDEVASTTPRKIANELANICALLTLSPQGLNAKDALGSAEGIPATPSQRLDAATVERCAQVAEELQGRGHWTGAPDAIAAAIRALATDPHQHGGKGA